ncbi:tRNA synthetases class I (C) catalytic domain-domain-containing protein [Ostreococcus tauri]|uniref:cysteine--tRNA ligase n=1 Tax=Ostreococcus tauri TaxID=70448 RepID=A0A1Y5I8L8_OSTTA|nr:tRNA synthetases class I (C) catalytic domain-domain-containing protein [Ostreococcus tauri]
MTTTTTAAFMARANPRSFGRILLAHRQRALSEGRWTRRSVVVVTNASGQSAPGTARANRGIGGTPLIRSDAATGPTLARNARLVYGSAVSETVENGGESGTEGRDLTKLWLTNTMTRKKELFIPRDPAGKKVQMYVCGVTVYDYSHIGHARVYVAFDVLYRRLMGLGYDVTYCRNFTDIDDKIIKRSNESGETCEALTNKFIDAFHEDMTALGCLRPTLEPRATECVDDIIAFIERLIAKGNAYEASGDVYFSVDTLPAYGALSGRKQDDNRAGERVAVDERKKNPADFALWKTAKPGEPTWTSPWGDGRPGWHIECSAMIEKMLGPTIDIHGGGQDLVFPHHENELAQSSAACGCGAHADENPFVRYWVHNGFVKVDSEKMSKSLGNFFTIREVLDKYHPFVLRFMLLGAHYRAPINYTQRALEEASDRVYYLYQTLQDVRSVIRDAAVEEDATKPVPMVADALKLANETEKQVLESLNDDLNTPAVMATLSAPLKSMNDFMTTKAGKKAVGRVRALQALLTSIEGVLEAVGMPRDEEDVFLGELRAKALHRAGLTEDALLAKIEERKKARDAKDFAESDRLRDELSARGIGLMDGAAVAWRPVPVVDA